MATEDTGRTTCAQADCRIGESGSCLEGFEQPVVDCPHFGKPILVQADLIVAKASGIGVPLPSGEDLGSDGVFEVARNQLCRLVVIAGSADAGKTTLISSIYERFQRGPIGHHCFAGSVTMLGFERRCHLARAACRGFAADTIRTPVTPGQRFLHLAIAHNERPSQRRDLVISDVPGEIFRQARDSREDAAKLTFVSRAAHFVLLLDGAKLISPETRAATRMEADQILRAMLDAGLLTNRSYVDCVFTKWDKVLELGERSEIEEFVADTRVIFEARFNGIVGRMRTYQTALRKPTSGYSAPGYDIDELLKVWLEETWLEESVVPKRLTIESERVFDHFGSGQKLI
jgi:hypothetical protein